MSSQTNNQANNQVAIAGQIKASLQALAPDFKAALPPHVTVERFIRVAQTAVLNNPDILKCERNSIYAACLKAAQDGLLPDGKEAALVSFKGNATYMPMVYGVLKKVRNSGELASLVSEIVYEKDSFEYWIDEKGPHLTHRPDVRNPDRGEAVGVYAIFILKDGSSYIEYMDKGQVMDVKSSSRGAEFGPWSGPFEHEMWRKSAIRRGSKKVPMSTDVEDIIRSDDQFYDFKKEDKPAEPKIDGQANRLNNLMKDKIATPGKADIDVTATSKPASETAPVKDDEPV